MGMKSVDLITNVNNVGAGVGGLSGHSIPPFSNHPHSDERYYLEDDRLYYNYNTTLTSGNNRHNNHQHHYNYGQMNRQDASGECPDDGTVELVGFTTFPRQNGFVDTYVCDKAEDESGSEANSDTEMSHV
ncbi:hypothetical protein PoB_001601900 [Plakobranchus ocellatus]|uniref:Uncharacterized protein n=1 Tax=Plakobranchus ocellatus TaxID=259542 RepID=A0AAV3Z685_9GAST|nr:hypothetical protein PoB_001601900 [Plakobranchus ocellatus]